MTRRVRLVLLCEDSQHEAFARRFLKRAGWTLRALRVEKAPRGRGSAAQFVQARFPTELQAYRRHARENVRLVVMLDGDQQGVAGRCRTLDEACDAAKVERRRSDEPVAIFVPTWNIETWLAYLDGQTVDEQRNNYPRLEEAGDCQRHVEELHQMCQACQLRLPAPHSLELACEKYRTRLV